MRVREDGSPWGGPELPGHRAPRPLRRSGSQCVVRVDPPSFRATSLFVGPSEARSTIRDHSVNGAATLRDVAHDPSFFRSTSGNSTFAATRMPTCHAEVMFRSVRTDTRRPIAMSEYTATQIPKPSDEQAFERCNEILWRCVLGDRSVQLHGRRGQEQHGVDLTGLRDGQPERVVGVQCKLKGEGQKLTEAEVRAEVEKALTFLPPLSEYIIVTTAPDDEKIQKLARQLSISASENRGSAPQDQHLGLG